MKCKCGGELIRIAVDAYQCNICGMKQAIAFASLPLEKDNYNIIGIDLAKESDKTVNKIINIGNMANVDIDSSKLIEEIKNKIYIAYQTSEKLFKK